MRGAKPKPVAFKIIEGDTRDRGVRRHAEVVKQIPKPAGKAKPPRSLTAAARKEWHRLAKDLERLGLLTAADQNIFAAYCQTLANLTEVEAVIREEGLLTTGTVIRKKNGDVIEAPQRAHPLLGQRNQLTRQLTSLAAELGLTPAGRARLGVRQEKPQSGLERLRGGLKK